MQRNGGMTALRCPSRVVCCPTLHPTHPTPPCRPGSSPGDEGLSAALVLARHLNPGHTRQGESDLKILPVAHVMVVVAASQQGQGAVLDSPSQDGDAVARSQDRLLLHNIRVADDDCIRGGLAWGHRQHHRAKLCSAGVIAGVTAVAVAAVAAMHCCPSLRRIP